MASSSTVVGKMIVDGYHHLQINKFLDALPNYLTKQFGYFTIVCTTCGDLVVGEPTLQVACGHDYCIDCIEDLVTLCCRDESLFPPKCCLHPIPAEMIAPFLTLKLYSLFNAKLIEFKVPPIHRIFCPNPVCSTFMGSSEELDGNLTCDRCGTVVCSLCKLVAHMGETCSENMATLGLRTLAQNKGWQKCPGCYTFVERIEGCNHMSCYCGIQFCYICAVCWKGCGCR